MRVFNTVCPHCGWKLSFTANSLDTEICCMQCGQNVVFTSDRIRSRQAAARQVCCPHCGDERGLNLEDFDTVTQCTSCGGEFCFTRQRSELKLYHTYAAILWGIFFGPILGCWYTKKNFEELEVYYEAADYRVHVVRYISWLILTPLLAWLISFSMILLAIPANADFLNDAAKFISQSWGVLPFLIGLCSTIGYARSFSAELKNHQTYSVHRSSWPAGLYFILISPLLAIPLLLIYVLEGLLIIKLSEWILEAIA